jgi:hypothetical protein
MKKILIGLTACLLVALLIATWLDPMSPLLWVASSSMWFTVMRIAMLGVLLLLLFTNPPRKLWLRLISMGLGVVMTVGSVLLVTQYQLNFLDAVVMLEVGVICLIEALEAELYDEISFIDIIKRTAKRQAGRLVGYVVAKLPKQTRLPSARIGSLTTK